MFLESSSLVVSKPNYLKESPGQLFRNIGSQVPLCPWGWDRALVWHACACTCTHTHTHTCRVALSPSLSLCSRPCIFLVIKSAMKQTNEGQKNRSGDCGEGFCEEVTFSLRWKVLGEEYFGQKIVWCVYRIKSRPMWLEHSKWLGEELRVWWEGGPGATSQRLCRQGWKVWVLFPVLMCSWELWALCGEWSSTVEAVRPEQGCTVLWWWMGLKWWHPR